MITSLQHIKKGFVDGLRSLVIDLDPPRREVVHKGGVKRHWTAVGQYMRHSIEELERSKPFQEAERCDAHHPPKHEQKEELENT
ncbi:MAG: hypothetical protein WD267_03455 [Balneolales bacterium]